MPQILIPQDFSNMEVFQTTVLCIQYALATFRYQILLSAISLCINFQGMILLYLAFLQWCFAWNIITFVSFMHIVSESSMHRLCIATPAVVKDTSISALILLITAINYFTVLVIKFRNVLTDGLPWAYNASKNWQVKFWLCRWKASKMSKLSLSNCCVIRHTHNTL